jgi:UDP-MurNAc hydroxylase
MKVQWYRSATVGIFSQAGTSILCDPWITDGAFIGSWFHWPPLEGFEFEDLAKRKWDAIYISHFHADHFDRKLVAAIARSNPDTRLFIPNYANKWLLRAVINCGFEPGRVIELENNSKFSFKDFVITMYVADYCNPQICGAQIPCMTSPRKLTANDSLALFEADGYRVLNANDALAVHSVQKLWPLIGEVDLLLGHYGGAGPFPQCFVDIEDDEKIQKASELGWQFVDRLIETGRLLNARYVMPYAGQYVLGGKLSSLNPFRSVIPISKVIARINSAQFSIPLTIQPFTEFNLKTANSLTPWIEPSKSDFNSYLDRIGQVSYPYEGPAEDWPNALNQMQSSLEKVKEEFTAMVDLGIVGSESSITISTESASTSINFSRREASITNNGPIFENHTEITCDSRLLRRLITRKSGYKGFTPYHFNQAEIGSHFTWRRSGPYPNETQLLNFMQCSI